MVVRQRGQNGGRKSSYSKAGRAKAYFGHRGTTKDKGATSYVNCYVICGIVFVVAAAMTLQDPETARKFLKFALNIRKRGRNGGTGGWRLATDEVLAKYDPGVCNIERVSIQNLPLSRFKSEFRFKKPVIVTFPKGAASWTEPDKWSRDGLVKAYSHWTIASGQSLEIVRQGGNGYNRKSFLDFVKALDNNTGEGEPQNYAFDRTFYKNSNLPNTLRMPEFFKVNDSRDESIFFLGSSLTGVVFHKHSDTWNGVVYGRKRWFLYPSQHTPPGGVHHGYSLLGWVTNVYPQLSEVNKPMECVQQAGEILYLPEGTYHATLNLGETVAVAIQVKQAVLRSEILFYEAKDLGNTGSYEEQNNPDSHYNNRLLEIYTELNQLLPESAEVSMKLGHTLMTKGQYETSMVWHSRAILKDPYFVVAHLHLGKTLAFLNKPDEAEARFLHAIELSPELWDCYKEFGEFLLKRNRHADALWVFKKGTELMPDLLPFWFFLSECQKAVGDTAGANNSAQVIARLKTNSGV